MGFGPEDGLKDVAGLRYSGLNSLPKLVDRVMAAA
jgi:hypothetical protein